MLETLLVTNQKINLEGVIYNWDQFLAKATSDEGIRVEDLYLDVKGIDKDLYEGIIDSMPTAKFFTLDGSVPEFVNISSVYDFREYAIKEENYGRIKQTAVTSSNPEEIRDSKVTKQSEQEIIKSLTGKDQSYEEEEEVYESDGNKKARIILFGSSKGGTGKTFTCLINAYRYAKQHPEERIAVSDFDIIDGQIGIAIHSVVSPTMLDYYKQFKFGNDDFATMERFKAKSDNFPKNVDFYLAPRDIYIEDDDFWDSIFINLIENYDTVFFDSGIDYMNYKPISTLYKIADKIILVSTTSIKSVSSVTKQIKRLKGEIDNKVFSKSDEIGKRLHLVITQAGKTDKMNAMVFALFRDNINIIAVFGMLTPQILEAEHYGRWDIFDKNAQFNERLDIISK